MSAILVSAMRRAGLLLVLAMLASTGRAQPRADAAPDGTTEQARSAWASGDRSHAYRLALQRLRRAPRDTAALALRLRLERAGEPGGLRVLQQRRLRKTARTLLSVDSTHALAHTVLGLAALDDARFHRHHITLGDGAGAGPLPRDIERALAASPLPATTGRLDLRVAMRESGWTSSADAADGAEETAERHLRAALRTQPGAAEPTRLLAALLLLTDQGDALGALATQTRAARPDTPLGWLLDGLAASRRSDFVHADAAFDKAFRVLSAADRARFTDRARLLPDAPGEVDDAFWRTRDPRLLTPISERRIEHIARIVEADLRFGHEQTPGADTERGRIFVRYGPPLVRRIVTRGPFAPPLYPGDAEDTARYDVWQYGDFRYVFYDATLSGRYPLYSPSAQAFSAGPRAASQATTDDAVQTDRRLRRESPERSQVASGHLSLLAQTATFRGSDGQTELIAVLGGDGAPPQGRSGAFLIADGQRVHERVRNARRTHAGAGWVEVFSLSARPGAYTLALEAEADTAVGSLRLAAALPPFEAGLQISDLLLATSLDDASVGPAPLVRGEVGIVPATRLSFAVGDPIHLYAEVYGLRLSSGRTDAEVRAVLVPEAVRSRLRRLWDGIVGRGDRPSVSTGAEVSGDASDESIALALDTAGQPSGRYHLILRVTDRATGETVEAARPLTLR